MTYGVFLGKWGRSPPSEASDTVLLVQRISFLNRQGRHITNTALLFTGHDLNHCLSHRQNKGKIKKWSHESFPPKWQKNWDGKEEGSRKDECVKSVSSAEAHLRSGREERKWEEWHMQALPPRERKGANRVLMAFHLELQLSSSLSSLLPLFFKYIDHIL